MSVDYINTLGLTKTMLDGYQEFHTANFPGGSKTHYDQVLLSTHKHLNEQLHHTVQARAELHDTGVYLTDHGPKHIELVMKRASELVRSEKSLRSVGTKSEFYQSCLTPYEVFLLALAIHFHDVGNMYGRDGHEQRIFEEMQKIGPLAIPHHQKIIISRIAACHGGKIDGSKNTIGTLPEGWDQDGEARYRPQCLAAVLRLADELADEHSRADNYGLLTPTALPATCLLFHKYAAGLRVGINPLAGYISLKFGLYVDDLKTPFKKLLKDKSVIDQFLLDEIYERTLKTYSEMQYCARFMRSLESSFHEVRVDIVIYPHSQTSTPVRQFNFILGDTDYPDYSGKERDALSKLARNFNELPDGAQLAATLSQIKIPMQS
jgi:hypothetical protein